MPIFGTASRLFAGMNIRSKLLVIYILVGLAPMLALSIYLVTMARGSVLDQRAGVVVADNQRTYDMLLDVTYLCANVSSSLEFDSGLQTLISTRYADTDAVYAAYRGYTLIDSFLQSYGQIFGVSIYINNDTMLTSGHFFMADPAVRASAWYRAAAASQGVPFWVYDTTFSGGSNLSLVRLIPVPSTGEFAVMVVSVKNLYFNTLLRPSSLTTLLCLNGGQTFYTDNAADSGKAVPLRLQPQRNPAQPAVYPSDYHGTRAMVFNRTLKGSLTGDQFQIVTLDTAAFADARQAAELLAYVLVFAAAAPVVLIFVFTGYLSRRIIVLRGAMRRVAQGELSLPAAPSGRDELGELAMDMNATITGIRALHKEILAENAARQALQTQQRKIEFELLVSQINPHFLFNTLETIRMKAKLSGNTEVAEISVKLGRLMRRALEIRDYPVTLQSELDAVQSYLYIQHFRFEDKVLYSIEIDEAVDPYGYKLLPLLLQPLVENAMIHGLERKEENGHIAVRIAAEEERLCIRVEDDGVGMEEKTLLALRRQLAEEDRPHDGIGLRNISRRIRLFYGEKYGLELESRPAAGTTVRLYLPFPYNPYNRDEHL